MKSIKYLYLLIIIMVLFSACIKEGTNAVEIGDYSYGVGYDEDTQSQLLDLSMYVYNGTGNSIVLHTVEPQLSDNIVSLITERNYVDCNDVILNSGEGAQINGIILFSTGIDKSGLSSSGDLILGFKVESTIIVP